MVATTDVRRCRRAECVGCGRTMVRCRTDTPTCAECKAMARRRLTLAPPEQSKRVSLRLIQVERYITGMRRVIRAMVARWTMRNGRRPKLGEYRRLERRVFTRLQQMGIPDSFEHLPKSDDPRAEVIIRRLRRLAAKLRSSLPRAEIVATECGG